MEYIILIIVAVAFIVFWRLDKRNEKRQALLSKQSAKDRLGDEAVIKAQAEFEKRLERNVGLPDGVGGRRAFIYWHLMRKWVGQLIAANRYNEGMSNKIKSDLLEYMYLLEHWKTLAWSSGEADDEKRRDAYGKEAWGELNKIELIENGVAAAIGKEAIEELAYTRSREHSAFDRSGKKPMAPPGYHYFPNSIAPYNELVKKID